MEVQNTPNTVDEGKTMAIISYITLIGTIIAYVMNMEKKNTFAAFHIRQMIGISLFSLVNTYVVGRFSSMASIVIWVFLVVIWFIGFIAAIQGEEKKIPLVGDLFQDWFQNI